MFTFFKKNKRGQGTNALVLSEEGIAHAYITHDVGQPPSLKSFHYYAIDNKAETSAVLKKVIQDNQLDNISIYTSLLTSDYNLEMMEKPEVAENELHQAVRWKIKDSLSFDVNDAVIDVFEIPDLKERGRTPLVYVAAAEKKLVKQRIQIFEDHDLEIESIDIAELVMRNIAALLPEDSQGVALLKLDGSKGLMTLTQDSSLYLTRNIDVDFGSISTVNSILGESPAESDGLTLEEGMSPDQQRTLDAIVLEVQRSLDYYESHFAKPAINSLVLAPLPYEIPGVINHLAGALGLQVRMLDLNAVLDITSPMSQEMQSHCFFAVGAALKESAVEAKKQGEAA